VEERRGARVGTVSGLALLAGGTAVAAVAGGAHSIFATVLLGLLAVGMGHSLHVEIRRQARRRGPGGWARQDTVNATLLALWTAFALVLTILPAGPWSVRAVGVTLTGLYAVSCGYFVHERRRSISWAAPQSHPGASPSEPRPEAPPADGQALVQLPTGAAPPAAGRTGRSDRDVSPRASAPRPASLEADPRLIDAATRYRVQGPKYTEPSPAQSPKSR
jgi:hypothetical protein